MFFVLFTDCMMNQLPRVSEALYVGMCSEIGTPTEVNIRREVMDIIHTLRSSVKEIVMDVKIKSGGYREGFR